MLGYRLYYLNIKGRIISAVELTAPCDDEAIDQVSAHKADGGLELWRRDRMIRVFPGVAPTQALQ